MKTKSKVLMANYLNRLLALLFFLFINHLPFAQTTSGLWGVTSTGGVFNIGSIYKVNADGTNYSVEYSFPAIPGEYPKYSLLTEGPDGKLYGVTNNTVFSFDPNNGVFHTLLENISFPLIGKLLLASNDKFYGISDNGGTYGHGCIYVYDPANNSLELIHSFNPFNDGGRNPGPGLIEAENGLLYGVCSETSFDDGGLIFQIDITSGIYLVLGFFDEVYAEVGLRWPVGSLAKHSNGKLYGSTFNPAGVFEFDISTGDLSRVVYLNAQNGFGTSGYLVETNDNTLIGLTEQGGANNLGTIFEVDPALNTCTKLYDFGNYGYRPKGSLIKAVNNTYYGLTTTGGSANCGVIFSFNRATNEYALIKNLGSIANGASNPTGTLTLTSNGKMYGMSDFGGTRNKGALFEFDPGTTNYSIHVNFQEGIFGRNPTGGLMQMSNGKFAGIAAQPNYTLYQYDPLSSTTTILIDGLQSPEMNSTSSLAEGPDEMLYGFSSNGGTSGDGYIFRLDPVNHQFEIMRNFSRILTGKGPVGTPLIATNGKLYGVARDGGAGMFYGTLFEYDIETNIITKKIDFNGTNGLRPTGSLIEAANGKIYGSTELGGTYNRGNIFEYNISNNTLTSLKSIADIHLAETPAGGLLQASDGHLYGVTSQEGQSSEIIFKYDISSDVLTKVYEFTSQNGYRPIGNLTESSNNKLIGITTSGGSFDGGVLFEFDPATLVYTILIEFNGDVPSSFLTKIIASSWEGSTSSDWHDEANWLENAIPDGTNDIFIPPAATNQPVISENVICDKLYVFENASLRISETGSLTVNENLNNQAGISGIIIESTPMGTGSLIHNNTYLLGTVQRYIDGDWSSSDAGWHFIGSPIYRQNILDFATLGEGNGYDIYKWDEQYNCWLNSKDEMFYIRNDGLEFNTGQGYIISYEQDQNDKAFTGRFNPCEDIYLPYLSSGGSTYIGWHLLGNPYPSSLTWNDGNWSLDDVSGIAKIWNSSNMSYSDILPGENIPVAQGFMVQVIPQGGIMNFKIPSASRVHQSDVNWYKHANMHKGIFMSVRSIDNNAIQECKIVLRPGSSEVYNFTTDSRFLHGYAPGFYAKVSGERLSTKFLPDFNTNRTIELGFEKLEGKQHYELKLNAGLLPEKVQVFLRDDKTSQIIRWDHITEYHFIAEDTDQSDRFKIFFAEGNSSGNEPIIFKPTIFVINDEIVVNYLDIPAEIKIINASGQTVFHQQITSPALAVKQKPGIYIVTVKRLNNMFEKKIVVSF